MVSQQSETPIKLMSCMLMAFMLSCKFSVWARRKLCLHYPLSNMFENLLYDFNHVSEWLLVRHHQALMYDTLYDVWYIDHCMWLLPVHIHFFSFDWCENRWAHRCLQEYMDILHFVAPFQGNCNLSHKIVGWEKSVLVHNTIKHHPTMRHFM